jgi:hypothetical protein
MAKDKGGSYIQRVSTYWRMAIGLTLALAFGAAIDFIISLAVGTIVYSILYESVAGRPDTAGPALRLGAVVVHTVASLVALTYLGAWLADRQRERRQAAEADDLYDPETR